MKWGSDMPDITIRPINTDEQEWIAQFIFEQWGSNKVISRGIVHYPQNLPGFVALYKGEKVGLITYTIEGRSCEIVTLDSTLPSSGVGTALIDAVREVATEFRMQAIMAYHDQRQHERFAFLSEAWLYARRSSQKCA